MFNSCARWGLSCVTLLCLLLTQGCLKQKTLVMLKADGSGNIVVTQVFTKQGVAMMEMTFKQMEESMMGQGSVSVSRPDDPYYSEKAIKRQARLFGPDVTFVKAKKIDKNGNRGFAAVYAFDDINDIHVPFNMASSLQSSMQFSMMDIDGMDEDDLPFPEPEDVMEFSFDKDSKTLSVDLPAFVADVNEFLRRMPPGGVSWMR